MKIEEALALLKEAGYKYTDKREMILTFFANEDRYRTAKDLLAYLEPHFEGISFDTIYRNLHLFNQLGILESTELNGEKNYQMSCAKHHHHHFICKDCGLTKEIHACPMDRLPTELNNFVIDDHKFEIYGLCPHCQQ
ncbi:Fur family transcriptional regulator, zinc uptake regulator [Amphibacillus marinus]|uniref:Fur family transcriptional regulator, zinc uptake regulator n=1 Tax=Amphibacillus marinus TaxID=872970 RepID=A0A1H8RWH3_9BACI|nr:Fur family transcriptional regulator [Amphibacillus marinus]SEO70710.1 Fur family transcriptional regulator, zinc uptake regulator [Amphibacillus marinus]